MIEGVVGSDKVSGNEKELSDEMSIGSFTKLSPHSENVCNESTSKMFVPFGVLVGKWFEVMEGCFVLYYRKDLRSRGFDDGDGVLIK